MCFFTTDFADLLRALVGLRQISQILAARYNGILS